MAARMRGEMTLHAASWGLLAVVGRTVERGGREEAGGGEERGGEEGGGFRGRLCLVAPSLPLTPLGVSCLAPTQPFLAASGQPGQGKKGRRLVAQRGGEDRSQLAAADSLTFLLLPSPSEYVSLLREDREFTLGSLFLRPFAALSSAQRHHHHLHISRQLAPLSPIRPASEIDSALSATDTKEQAERGSLKSVLEAVLLCRGGKSRASTRSRRHRASTLRGAQGLSSTLNRSSEAAGSKGAGEGQAGYIQKAGDKGQRPSMATVQETTRGSEATSGQEQGRGQGRGRKLKSSWVSPAQGRPTQCHRGAPLSATGAPHSAPQVLWLRRHCVFSSAFLLPASLGLLSQIPGSVLVHPALVWLPRELLFSKPC